MTAAMKIILYVFVVLLKFFGSSSDAYRILGIFPAPAYSHFALGSRLMKGIAEKGHDVTMIAPFKEKKPLKGYREIILEEVAKNAEGTVNLSPY